MTSSRYGQPATSLPELDDHDERWTRRSNESLRFGFAQADADGHVPRRRRRCSLQLTDPDGSGRLTLAELTTADIADVMACPSSEDAGSNELAASITLTADVAGIDFTGTVSITDAALFEGAEPDVNISLDGANPIEMLTNLGPDSALAGLNQILSAFGAGMIAGDRPLPFLDGGLFIPAGIGDDFDKVFDAVKPLYDYVQSRSVQLNCGAFPVGTPAADGVRQRPDAPGHRPRDGPVRRLPRRSPARRRAPAPTSRGTRPAPPG